MDKNDFVRQFDHIVPLKTLPQLDVLNTYQFSGYVFADGQAASALEGVTLSELQTFVPPDFWLRLVRVWQGLNALKSNRLPIVGDPRFDLPPANLQGALALAEHEENALFDWLKDRLYPDNMAAHILQVLEPRSNWQISFAMLGDKITKYLLAKDIDGPIITMADLLDFLNLSGVRRWLVENYMPSAYSS